MAFILGLKEIFVPCVFAYMAKLKILTAILIWALFLPSNVAVAAELQVGGWIPYWQDTMGTESASRNLDNLDIIYPFVFEMTAAGIPVDKAGLSERQWEDLMEDAKDNGTLVIPTILWTDGAQIHRVLSNPTWRALHVEIIARFVEAGDFDGIDIDYESKLSATKDNYSLFLKELKGRLDDDQLLTCTVEARMPPTSRWRDVPAVIEYANDYEEIGEHCDVVEVMAYDQQRADLLLNDSRKGEPYIPVADATWVEKVLDMTVDDIPASKIMLGVPTYGRKWTMTVAPDWYKEYKGNGAINQPDAEELAEENDAPIGENVAGEKSYTYFSPNSPFKILDVLPVPDGTKVGFEAAAKALLFANFTKMEVPVELVWYSDADAIADKVEIAKDYGLKGISIFKIDGEEDSDIWDLF
jgi:spore germination protein YaaH